MSAGERTETTLRRGDGRDQRLPPLGARPQRVVPRAQPRRRVHRPRPRRAQPDQLRETDRFELVSPQDVEIDPVTYQWMATIYDGFELSCALKPWLLRHLLRDAGAALYLDSDILVCDSLEHIAGRASARGLVLSPHRLEPPPRGRAGARRGLVPAPRAVQRRLSRRRAWRRRVPGLVGAAARSRLRAPQRR